MRLRHMEKKNEIQHFKGGFTLRYFFVIFLIRSYVMSRAISVTIK